MIIAAITVIIYSFILTVVIMEKEIKQIKKIYVADYIVAGPICWLFLICVRLFPDKYHGLIKKRWIRRVCKMLENDFK